MKIQVLLGDDETLLSSPLSTLHLQANYSANEQLETSQRREQHSDSGYLNIWRYTHKIWHECRYLLII